MTNNQIDPKQESDQLSDEELESVAGGTVGASIDNTIDATKDFIIDVYEAGEELISDVLP